MTPPVTAMVWMRVSNVCSPCTSPPGCGIMCTASGGAGSGEDRFISFCLPFVLLCYPHLLLENYCCQGLVLQLQNGWHCVFLSYGERVLGCFGMPVQPGR